MSGPVRTVTALKRWSCSDRQLPPVDAIRAIHVYDFDNTRKFDSAGFAYTSMQHVWNSLSIDLLTSTNSLLVTFAQQTDLGHHHFRAPPSARLPTQWRLVAQSCHSLRDGTGC